MIGPNDDRRIRHLIETAVLILDIWSPAVSAVVSEFYGTGSYHEGSS